MNFTDLPILLVIYLKSILYFFTTFYFSFFFKNLWIIITFLVSYSKEMFLKLIILRMISRWEFCFLSAKIGTSFCILLIIRISMLLINSLKLRLWEESLWRRSLVMGWLLPSYEARILTFKSPATTLSFLMNDDWALLFFIVMLPTCE